MSTKLKYKPLTIPQVKWSKKTFNNTFGEVVAQPLESGFGITFGNALRRVLLGAVEGSAVTSVIVKGVNNEFSSLPGVVEDIMQILLNIKEIVIKNKEGNPGKMHLNVKGEGVARVADIKADAHLELVNQEHVIAHLATNGEIDIEFFVESGRGYQPAQWPIGKSLQEDNRIYIDAMFSPVIKVYFDVEKTRVGKDIDYDKLTLKIHTDGSESPSEVLHYCVSVLRTQLEHFLIDPEIPFNEISASMEESKEEETEDVTNSSLKGVKAELLFKPIEELELSARAQNCLITSDIKRIIDLVNLTDDDVLKIKNFGKKSLREVKDAMKTYNLSFGMDIKESDAKKLLKDKDNEETE